MRAEESDWEKKMNSASGALCQHSYVQDVIFIFLLSRPPSVSSIRSASMMISRASVDSFCARTCLGSIGCSLLSKNRGTCAVGFCSHHRFPAGYRTMRLQCICNCNRFAGSCAAGSGRRRSYAVEAEEKDPKQKSKFRRIPRPPSHYLHRSAVQRDRSPSSVLVLTSNKKWVLIFFLFDFLSLLRSPLCCGFVDAIAFMWADLLMIFVLLFK